MTMVNSGLKGLNMKMCKCLVPNETNMSDFHPLEVADRGRDPRLQAVKFKLDNLTGKFFLLLLFTILL